MYCPLVKQQTNMLLKFFSQVGSSAGEVAGEGSRKGAQAG
jgi:hypothetical protein